MATEASAKYGNICFPTSGLRFDSTDAGKLDRIGHTHKKKREREVDRRSVLSGKAATAKA